MPCEVFGWLWMSMGVWSGALLGLFFHRTDFLGGYDHWRRRLIRLGHIAFFGTGILNILLGLTLVRHGWLDPLALTAQWCMIAGGFLMPVCCAIAAFKPALKFIFVLPVIGIGLACNIMAWKFITLALNGGLL